jgi:hypothetical protein
VISEHHHGLGLDETQESARCGDPVFLGETGEDGGLLAGARESAFAFAVFEFDP